MAKQYKVVISKSKNKQFFVTVKSRANGAKLYNTETYKNHAYAVRVAKSIKDGRNNYWIVDETIITKTKK